MITRRVVVGGHGAIGLPGPTLRVVFAIVLVWLGVRYLGISVRLRPPHAGRSPRATPAPHR